MRENANSVSGIRVREVADKAFLTPACKGSAERSNLARPTEIYIPGFARRATQRSEELHGLTCLVYLSDMVIRREP